MRLNGPEHDLISLGARREELRICANDDDVECRELVTGPGAAGGLGGICPFRRVRVMVVRVEAVPEAKDRFWSSVCVDEGMKKLNTTWWKAVDRILKLAAGGWWLAGGAKNDASGARLELGYQVVQAWDRLLAALACRLGARTWIYH